MTPKQFLIIDGVILILLGIGGFAIGDRSLLGGAWALDTAEDFVHTIAGAVTLAAAFIIPPVRQRWFVLLIALLDVVFATLGFALQDRTAPNLVFTNLDNPGDNLIHLALRVWGLAVFAWSLNSRARVASSRPSR